MLLLVEPEMLGEGIFVGNPLPERFLRGEVDGGIGSQLGQHLGEDWSPRNSQRESREPVDEFDKSSMLKVDLPETRFKIFAPKEDPGKNVGRKSCCSGHSPLCFH